MRLNEPEIPRLISAAAEPFEDVDAADLRPLLRRIGNARVVLLGEETHGSSEFYRMRAKITRELVLHAGFDVVAVEADWPDAALVDAWVRHRVPSLNDWAALSRFPAWMWRNREMLHFLDWLHEHDGVVRPYERRVGFYGLDLYSMYASIEAVSRYLDRVDPEAAILARERYACLDLFEHDPASYGVATLSRRYRECERDVVEILATLLAKRMDYIGRDGEAFLDAVQNARLIANAEHYYRTMYYGGVASWNLRDRHMFHTLLAVLDFRGPRAKAVVWEHNSHLGDARFTEMGSHGELNLGQLCREYFGDAVYSVGFGTHTGTVAAASDWEGPMEVKLVLPSREDSYEHLFHLSRAPRLFLPLRRGASADVRRALLRSRLERAIGVVYRPEMERTSHYFEAILPEQFDEFCWFEETNAIEPLPAVTVANVPDTYPSGL